MLDINPASPPSVTELKGATEPIQYRGRLLSVDLVSSHQMVCTIQQDGQVNCSFRGRRRTFALSECDCLVEGPPPYFICGVALRLIDPDLDWQWIAHALEEGLDPAKLMAHQNEEGAPLVELAGYQGPELLPELRLTDSRGLFGELWLSGEPFTASRADGLSFERDLIECGYRRAGLQYVCPLDRVQETLQFLLELGWKVFDQEGRALLLHTGQQLQLCEEGPSIEVRGRFEFGQKQLPVERAAESFQRAKFLAPLDDFHVALLPKMPWNGTLQFTRKHFGELQPLLQTPGVMAKGTLFERSSLVPPERFVGTLRPYQQEAVAWLQGLHKRTLSGLLADEMGLGKTVQALAFLASVKSTLPHLIVAPASLLFNWQREAERFVPSLEVRLYHGRERTLQNLAGEVVLLTSYDTLRRDGELAEQTFCVIVLDEAQHIKNPGAQVARAAHTLRGEMRLSVTGTPIENRASELWSQFAFLEPELLGPRSTFSPTKEIAERIQPYFLRRTKKDVALQLPEKIEQTVLVEPSGEERLLYDTLLRLPRETTMQQLELLLRLRQACCHPLLLSGVIDELPPTSAKLTLLVEEVESVLLEGKQLLIFSSFTTVLTLIGRALAAQGWTYLKLDGEVRDRESVVNRFQRGEVPILLLSLKVGGVGLNLTAAEAVFLYEPWWNDAVEAQAIDRAHRIGQTRILTAKRYIVRGSVEERMVLLKRKKQELGKLLTDPSFFSSIDLSFLFGD